MTKNKILLIIEAPGKLSSISKYLGPEYIVRASGGHTHDLWSRKKGDIGVDIENNFKLHYRIIPGKHDKLQSLIDAASGAKEIIMATDGDREGSAIAQHIAEALSSTGLRIRRAIFNEITKKGIEQGLKNLTEIDQNMVDAAHARRCLDRIVGYQASPFIMQAVENGTSVGRVQSPTLKLIVEREHEINNFKPEEYWNLSVHLSKIDDIKNNFQAKYMGKIFTQDVALQIKRDLENTKYHIFSIVPEEKKKKPPPPLTTSTLTAEAAGKFKFTAAKTMTLAQSLYQSGNISYHRTDSVRLSPDLVEDCREYLLKKGLDLPASPNTYSNKDGAQDAHTAICPVSVFNTLDKMYLSNDEQKIYQLIWERFVCCQMNPALYDMVSVIIKTDNNHSLKVQGKILKYKGWLEIIHDTEDKDIRLPELRNKDQLVLSNPIKLEQKFTQPPPRYNEKSLIEELEKKGIGRPATIANILSKITDKDYANRKNNIFFPTELGQKVVSKLDKHFDFMQYSYTADMELALDKIAEGKSDYLSTMQNFYAPFSKQLKQAYSADQKDYGFICEKCQDKMELAHGMFGFYMRCLSRPECKFTFSCDMIDEKPVRRENKLVLVEGISCPKCQGQMSKKDGRFGPFYSCTSPKCYGTRKVPFGKKCSDCSGELYATIYHGENVLFCMNYPQCFHKEKLQAKVPNPNKL